MLARLNEKIIIAILYSKAVVWSRSMISDLQPGKLGGSVDEKGIVGGIMETMFKASRFFMNKL